MTIFRVYDAAGKGENMPSSTRLGYFEVLDSNVTTKTLYESGSVIFAKVTGDPTIKYIKLRYRQVSTYRVTLTSIVGYDSQQRQISSISSLNFTWDVRKDIKAIPASRGNDNFFGNKYRDIIHGGPGRDIVVGNAGNDVLFGDAGNDVILGNSGTDTLIGGSGKDKFRYMKTSGGNDRIADFRRGKDKIQVSQSGFKSMPRGVLRSRYFRSNRNGVAKDKNDYFVFSTKTKTLYFDRNGSRKGGRVTIATFNNRANIRRTDIAVI